MTRERRTFDLAALGGRLRQLRELRGLSQLALDDKAGLARGTVGHYECARREPELAMLVAVATALGADLYWLLGVAKPRYAAKVYAGELWYLEHKRTRTRRMPQAVTRKG